MTDNWQDGGFGLYLHWPFCAAKCPYCDFNSHVVARIDQEAWKQAYLTEIDRYAKITPGRVLRSVYFGGGTPSLMAGDTVAAILDRVAAHWTLSNDIEVTLEANPGSAEAGRFADYADAGVSRVSIGVQALNDVDLRRLGRLHSADDARRAVETAKDIFARVSFDLIYARQGQSRDDWSAELQLALSMAVDHLSLYQLTIEPGTAFADRYAAGRLRDLPDDDLSADLFDITQDMCSAAGLPAYEVSNHARPGSESRHNLIYWRYGDYIGIGPGAHGRLTLDGVRWATEAYSDPGRWIKGTRTGQSEMPTIRLTGLDQATEYLLMGLRINEGIDMKRFERFGHVALCRKAITDLVELGLVEHANTTLRATQRGRTVLNSVIRALLPDTGAESDA